MTPKIEILGQKFAQFDHFEGSFLTILRVEKVVFLAFSYFLKFLGQLLSLFATHTDCSPLGPREALKNVDKASSALLVVRVGGWVGGAYLPLKIFRCQKMSFEQILFFKCL